MEKGRGATMAGAVCAVGAAFLAGWVLPTSVEVVASRCGVGVEATRVGLLASLASVLLLVILDRAVPGGLVRYFGDYSMDHLASMAGEVPVKEAPGRGARGDLSPKKWWTMAEVAEGNGDAHCLMVVNGKVYDVSRSRFEHPGGDVIFSWAGLDATDMFAAFHKRSTYSSLEPLCVGEISDPNAEELLRDWRAMRARMVANGLFKSSGAFYLYKTVTTGAIGVIGAGILLYASDCGRTPEAVSALQGLASAVTIGLFWQQCGWLAHDYCHHQVFQSNRLLNNLLGQLVGAVWLGFSPHWWKNKHNVHHATPNVVDDHGGPVDPDIDTMPLLLWTEKMLAGRKVSDLSGTEYLLLAIQRWTLLPILSVARMSWLWESIKVGVSPSKFRTGPGWAVEAVGLLLHHAWFLCLSIYCTATPLHAALYYAAAQTSSGLMLGSVFIVSHSGMATYTDRRSFAEEQIISTRNVHGGAWNDWFSGGLNRQVEHHLFPTAPRHNLHHVAKEVKGFCGRHGFDYQDLSFSRATFAVLDHLSDVTDAVIQGPAKGAVAAPA